MTELPAPPVPADLDLRHFDCMPLDVRALRDSDMRIEVSPEAGWFAVQIWGAAWHQIPAGSLPNDDEKLRMLAGVSSVRTWRKLREGVLRGFSLHSDGRLYHRRLTEIALDSFSRSRAGKRGAKAKWDKAKSLKDNTTADAVASGTTHGTSDGTLYSTADGKPDGTSDGKTVPRREGNTLPPLPPLPATAGSGSLKAPPARPTAPPQGAQDDRVEVDVGGGVIFAISSIGLCEHIGGPLDAEVPTLTQQRALELRDWALRRKPVEAA